jgi:hypothetical protein
MSETRKCADCPALVQRKRPNAMFPLRCKACKTAARTALKKRWLNGVDGPFESLGPEVPLNGLSAREAGRQRAARIAKAAAEGVPLYALMERFGVDKSTVSETLRKHGVQRRDDGLPFGVPA